METMPSEMADAYRELVGEHPDSVSIVAYFWPGGVLPAYAFAAEIGQPDYVRGDKSPTVNLAVVSFRAALCEARSRVRH